MALIWTVGLYLDRCALIWAYVPLFERLAIGLTGCMLIWTGRDHIWPGGPLSGHIGLYMDSVGLGLQKDRVGLYLD